MDNKGAYGLDRESIEKEMMRYYDEVVKEYDLVYSGKGQASLKEQSYLRDIKKVYSIVSEYGEGHSIDIACGTGYWFPVYAENCTDFTFVDRSKNMLEECKRRVKSLGYIDKAKFIRMNALNLNLNTKFDSAIAGFLIGHFTEEQEKRFFQLLKEILVENGTFLILDGTWTDERKKVRSKHGIQVRKLIDGRRFRVYRRYLDENDLSGMAEKYGYRILDIYFGEAFFAFKACFKK